MLLAGSCHCGVVKFRVLSPNPYPYLACYCSICRKTAGGGGYAINLAALSETLEVEGEENLSVYQARMEAADDPPRTESSPARRNYCRICGSARCPFAPPCPEL